MCPLVPCQLARAPSQRPGPRGGGMNEAFIPKWEPRLGSLEGVQTRSQTGRRADPV